MRLSVDLNSFKSNHKKKKNQIIYSVKNCKDYTKVENLFNFVLAEKIVSFLSLLKKVQLEVATLS